jgi:transglutaminase-like putative cysteine protease
VINRRAMLGGAIIVAWLLGLALLVRREYFRPQLERLAQAGIRVAPGVVYYGVLQGSRQIGFASSTIDTAQNTITVTDYLVADLPVGGKPRRAVARTNVSLSRALRLKKFDLSFEAEGPPVYATATVEADTILFLNVTSGKEKSETQRVALSGPVLLPTLVPLAIALGEGPKVGKHYILPVFDPASMSKKDVGMDIRAESLFVVSDSAVMDPQTSRWRGVRPDTVRAWQVTSPGGGVFTGWIDEQGRIVQTTQLGLELRRMPYELAFLNWRADTAQRVVTDDEDILEITAIAASKKMERRVDSLRVRLSNVNLNGFDLNGQRQRLVGDTLTISTPPNSLMAAPYKLPFGRLRDPVNTRAEPLIQSHDPQIMRLAARIANKERDPQVVAKLLNAWVHDSIRSRITFGVPNAIQVLESRSGDCNEHTQLFVALARALGLPARIASGLAFVDGKFYYHAWPEVLLGDWVAVDPTFGQFPADAAHIRFVVGGLTRQTELLRLMGHLKIDVLAAKPGR